MNKPKKAKLFALRNLPVDIMRITAAPGGLLWLRPRILYTSKAAKKRIRGGALIIANHTRFIDPVFTMFTVWYRRQYFVCHKVFLETKAGPWMRLAGCCIPIDAENFNLGSFRQITESLKDGKAVVLFPEGHVNQSDDALQEFKSGMVLISMQSKCPIVPIYLKPPKHWYNRLTAVIGEPVDITALCGGMPVFSQIQEITKLLREREQFLEEYANNH